MKETAKKVLAQEVRRSKAAQAAQKKAMAQDEDTTETMTRVPKAVPQNEQTGTGRGDQQFNPPKKRKRVRKN